MIDSLQNISLQQAQALAYPLSKTFFLMASFFLVPFFIILLHTFSTSAIQTSNQTDMISLLAVKAQITHDPLQFLTSWNESAHFCKWGGVICGHIHQRVRILNLSSLGLVGTLSPHISNLTFLTGLNLELNDFHGQIPPEIAGLSKLRHLNLTNNSFSGDIPANISRCSNLVLIRLGWNRLTGSLPFQLGNLEKVERFHLHYNNFSGIIPQSFGNFSSIRSISFAGNNFQGRVPVFLGKLKTLNFLGLGLNQFSGVIPREIFNLSSLVTFSVAFNRLEGILPPDLGFRLPNLQVLNVGHNLITGPLPVSLSNASNLVELDVTGSMFSGEILIDFRNLPNIWWLILANNPLSGDLQFLNSLTNCRNLKVLDLSNCMFEGALPYSVANLSTNLLSLRLGGNQISGSITAGIANLVNLTELQLQKNKFTGRIPAVLGSLSKLQLLDMSKNELLGQIPSSLSNLSQLYLLHLDKNHLNGSIPLSFGDFQYLQDLDLSYNNLSGTIPRTLMTVSSLTLSLNLGNNQLSGSLPSEMGGLKNLESLDVSENQLSGEIPISLGSCVSLEHLDMAGNSLDGSIPLSFGSLRGLEYLNLSCNNLSGQIPGFFQDLSLKNLNLSFNRFEGEIPSEGIFKNASGFSINGNDNLCGGIADLRLPMCPNKGKSHYHLKLVIFLLCGVLTPVLLVSFIIIRRLRKVKDPPISSPEITMLLKVTYASLFKATEGFSSANLIGSGSFGSVYKATLESGREVVAVKVFRLHNRASFKSFVTECRALRNIRHRNLVKIYTVCSSIDHLGNEFKALVYEFMPNGSLDRWLHGDLNDHDLTILPLLQRVSIAIDVASALEYLHHHCERTIVHCDLKPSNVLLDDEMVARLGDFGLSKFIPESISRSNTLSSSIGVRGTIGYAPPEYGMGSNYSPAGDVYSFGILLLEMFTGKKPTDNAFEGGMNLYNYVRTALPEGVDEILDPTIVLRSGNDGVELEEQTKLDQKRECLISIMRIGIACSVESPKQRMDIADVVKELQLIKDIMLACSTNHCSSTSGSLRFEGSSSRSAAHNWQNVL